MTASDPRQRMLATIRQNIDRSGCHIYGIKADAAPGYLYTIGLSPRLGFELIFAGGTACDRRLLTRALNRFAETLTPGMDPYEVTLEMEGLGPLALAWVDKSWRQEMLLGALDYYDVADIKALQIVPQDEEYLCFDIPNLYDPFVPEDDPAWRWKDTPCPFDLPSGAVVCCDWDLVLGYEPSEVMRVEEDVWQIFSGDPPENDSALHRLPLVLVLAFFDNLAPAIDLAVGKGLIREDDDAPDAPWQNR
jgi:hypothetical protein